MCFHFKEMYWNNKKRLRIFTLPESGCFDHGESTEKFCHVDNRVLVQLHCRIHVLL